MSGADAGRAAAGAAGIVSAFVLTQIFMCRLLPSHPPRRPDRSHGVTRGGKQQHHFVHLQVISH